MRGRAARACSETHPPVDAKSGRGNPGPLSGTLTWRRQPGVNEPGVAAEGTALPRLPPGAQAAWGRCGREAGPPPRLASAGPEGHSPLEWGGGGLTAQGRPTEENPLAQLRVSAVPGALMANGTLGPGREAPQTEPIVCTAQSGTEFCLSFSVLLGTCLFI